MQESRVKAAVLGPQPFLHSFKNYRKLIRFLFTACVVVLFSGKGFAQLVPDSVSLSFGRVMPDQTIEQVISFSNPTEYYLEVESIQLTPPLYAQDISSKIPPGDNGQFKLVLGADREFGAFEGIIRVNFKNDIMAPILFDVEGYVIPPVEIKPYPAFFVATHFGIDKKASLEIINHQDEPLNLVNAVSDSGRYSLQLEEIEPGQRYRLNLFLDGSTEPGQSTDEIVFISEPPAKTPLLVQANTIVRAQVYTFPDSVHFGALPLEIASDKKNIAALSQTLMIYRRNTEDFEIKAHVDLDYILINSERGPNGDRYQLTLSIVPERIRPGLISGMIRVTTNDDDYRELNIPVTGEVLE